MDQASKGAQTFEQLPTVEVLLPHGWSSREEETNELQKLDVELRKRALEASCCPLSERQRNAPRSAAKLLNERHSERWQRSSDLVAFSQYYQ